MNFFSWNWNPRRRLHRDDTIRLFIPDAQLPIIDQEVLDALGVGRWEFMCGVIHSELERDVLAYDEGILVDMDDFLVQNLTQIEHDYFALNKSRVMQYEDAYIRAHTIVARYIKPILIASNFRIDRIEPRETGYFIDLLPP